ncbi:MAG TPA: hypothetical protein VMF90_26355 [Rhizobiaceae bacterium]|nr:hypothetical protein [Rhizobiaceae bacterium]
MDWTVVVSKNREKLARVLAALVKMAGLSETRTHLPRHIHRAVLRLLRPAESAARRLIIIAARGLVVSLPKPRPPRPKPKTSFVKKGSTRSGIVLPRGMSEAQFRALMTGGDVKAPTKSGFRRLPLADPLSRFRRRRRSRPAPAVRPFEYYEPLDATRLGFRLQAVGDVLDNLPVYAQRFARWKIRRDAAGAQNKELRDAGRIRRSSPLKPGRAPGSLKKPKHEVHDVLADLQHFARLSLERPDTS